MKIIDLILGGVQKLDEIIRIVRAVLAGFEAFTASLKEQNESIVENAETTSAD